MVSLKADTDGHGLDDTSPDTRALIAPAKTEDLATVEKTLALGQLGQVSMLCRSAAASESWYREVLGLAHLYSYGPLVFFDCAGTRLFLREVAPAEWRASSTLYFRVAAIAAAHATLAGRGVRFSEAPQLVHRHESGDEEWMAFFADPDGNVLALMATVPAAG